MPVVNIAAQAAEAAESSEGPKFGKPRPKAASNAESKIAAAIKAKEAKNKAAAALQSPQKAEPPQDSPTPAMDSEPLSAASRNGLAPEAGFGMPVQGPSGMTSNQNRSGPLAPTSVNTAPRMDSHINGGMQIHEGHEDGFRTTGPIRPSQPGAFPLANGHVDGAAAPQPAAEKANGVHVDKENAPPARKPATIVDLSKRGKSWAGVVGRIPAEELARAAAAAAAGAAALHPETVIDSALRALLSFVHVLCLLLTVFLQGPSGLTLSSGSSLSQCHLL